MDDIVRQAIAKWPHVPACCGWLGLDARGNWYMRDDQAQAAGPFAASADGSHRASKGSLLLHDKLIDFIARNYESDASGQWFRAHGNENWEFDELGYMKFRYASINDQPIAESERKFRWERNMPH